MIVTAHGLAKKICKLSYFLSFDGRAVWTFLVRTAALAASPLKRADGSIHEKYKTWSNLIFDGVVVFLLLISG